MAKPPPQAQQSISQTRASGPTAPAPSDPGPLPQPQALIDVITRLADPAVPGVDKLTLVENTTPPDAAALDSFATALRYNGFAPVTVRASDIVPNGPDAVVARITLTGPDTDPTQDVGEFAFPMEFKRVGSGWQLSRETADMLLVFGNAGPDTPVPPSANPPVTPSPAPPR